MLTVEQLSQQLSDLGWGKSESRKATSELKNLVSSLQECDNKRFRAIDHAIFVPAISSLLSAQKTGRKSAAVRRQERRRCEAGYYVKDLVTGQMRFIRPMSLPSIRGTDRQVDLKCEMMYLVLYWDSARIALLNGVPYNKQIDTKDQLVPWLSAARTVIEILHIFDLVPLPIFRARKELCSRLVKGEPARAREECTRIRNANEIIKDLESENNDALIKHYAMQIAAEKIFDAFKLWNPSQVSGLPRGAYSNKLRVSADGKAEFQCIDSIDNILQRKVRSKHSFKR